MERIRNPKRVQVPRCSCTVDQETLSNVTLGNSTMEDSSCHCLTAAQHRRLEEDLGRRVERVPFLFFSFNYKILPLIVTRVKNDLNSELPDFNLCFLFVFFLDFPLPIFFLSVFLFFFSASDIFSAFFSSHHQRLYN